MKTKDRLHEVLPFLAPPLKKALAVCCTNKDLHITEVRLHSGRPLSVMCGRVHHFLSSQGEFLSSPERALTVSPQDVSETLLLCCGHSLHSCADQLRQGFVTLPGGHRAGTAGTARTENGKVISVHSITSMNIRIAGYFPLAGEHLLERLYRSGLHGVLIAGPPISGKTTVLKSMISLLSGGWQGRYRTVCIADERGELSSAAGETADILTGYPKSAAIEIALRTFSPELICCDELSADEAEAVRDTLNAGVPLLCTVHASSPAELLRKRWMMPLLRDGIFREAVFLSPHDPGRAIEILPVQELLKGEITCVQPGS